MTADGYDNFQGLLMAGYQEGCLYTFQLPPTVETGEIYSSSVRYHLTPIAVELAHGLLLLLPVRLISDLVLGLRR